MLDSLGCGCARHGAGRSQHSGRLLVDLLTISLSPSLSYQTSVGICASLHRIEHLDRTIFTFQHFPTSLAAFPTLIASDCSAQPSARCLSSRRNWQRRPTDLRPSGRRPLSRPLCESIVLTFMEVSAFYCDRNCR